MDRVIELSGCVGRAGQEATILLQVSVPLHTTTTLQHASGRTSRSTSRSGVSRRMRTFREPSLPASLMTHLNPSLAQEQALSLFLARFLFIDQRRQGPDASPKAVNVEE